MEGFATQVGGFLSATGGVLQEATSSSLNFFGLGTSSQQTPQPEAQELILQENGRQPVQGEQRGIGGR